METCGRCSGLMIKVPALDHAGISAWLWLWRCPLCGNYEDEMVIKNRHMKHKSEKNAYRRRGENLSRAYSLFKGGGG